jgi:hypothetical protein
MPIWSHLKNPIVLGKSSLYSAFGIILRVQKNCKCYFFAIVFVNIDIPGASLPDLAENFHYTQEAMQIFSGDMSGMCALSILGE